MHRKQVPRKSSADWLDEGLKHIWLPYAQMKTTDTPLAVIGAKGSHIQLADGRTLIDGIASWWSMCHGYQHPHIVNAIQQQAATLSHVMLGGLAHEQAYHLAARLSALTKMDRVFFSDSGSVAVEVALKMALQYWRNKGDFKRTKFICFNHGYHGDTIGAMSVSSKSPFTSAFDALTLKNYALDIPTDEYSFAEFEETVAAIKGQVAGLIIEPLVQCAGGFKFHSADILSEIRRVCRQHDILFIADEIATGFGRTGSMFACQEAAIIPDIMCLGKALTGGHLPLAATLSTQEIFEAFWSDDYEKAFMHGPTYMGNPLACAAANASLDVFANEPRLAQVEALESTLWEALRHLLHQPHIKDVRVKGALAVVETNLTREALLPLRKQFIENGVWLRPLGGIIYIMPPLSIAKNDIHQLTNAISTALRF
jgi:adenosylmethionine-8-amino-7-oxononanoate aminotransferase